MTRDEKIARAYGLRYVGGWSLEAIALELGVRHPTVWKWLNPQRAKELEKASNAKRGHGKRAWDKAMRATCGRCGGPMCPGSLKADGSTRVKGDRCGTCATDHRVNLVLEMWRLREKERLLNTQIAKRLDTTPWAVASELTCLRALGYEVSFSPYRGSDRRPTVASAVEHKNVRPLGKALKARGIYPTRAT